MKTLLTRGIPRDAQVSDHGRIACPWRAYEDIDVERCLSCPRAVARGFEGGETWVRCERPPERPLHW